MKRLCLVASVVAALCAVMRPAEAHVRFRAPVQPAVWTMGYYAAYERGRLPVDEVPWSDLTHIAFGPVLMNPLAAEVYHGLMLWAPPVFG